jgi:hypothetical protein
MNNVSNDFNIDRGVRGVGWFGFEHISYPNRETKMYAV